MVWCRGLQGARAPVCGGGRRDPALGLFSLPCSYSDQASSISLPPLAWKIQRKVRLTGPGHHVRTLLPTRPAETLLCQVLEPGPTCGSTAGKTGSNYIGWQGLGRGGVGEWVVYWYHGEAIIFFFKKKKNREDGMSVFSFSSGIPIRQLEAICPYDKKEHGQVVAG